MGQLQHPTEDEDVHLWVDTDNPLPRSVWLISKGRKTAGRDGWISLRVLTSIKYTTKENGMNVSHLDIHDLV